jgi:hypothetical protein
LRWVELVHSGGRPVGTLVVDEGEADELGIISLGGEGWFIVAEAGESGIVDSPPG